MATSHRYAHSNEPSLFSSPESAAVEPILPHHRKLAEAMFHSYHDLHAALATITLALMNRLDITSLLETIILEATQLLGTTHGYVCLLNADGRTMELTIGTGLYSSYLGVRVRPSEDVCGIIWQTAEPLIIQYYDSWPTRSSLFIHEPLQSVIGVPLHSNHHIVGILGIGYTESDFVGGKDEVELLTSLAQLASLALDNSSLHLAIQQERAKRRRAEEALWQAEESYRNIFDHAVEGIFRMSPTGRYQCTNLALARLYGYESPEEVMVSQNSRNGGFYLDPYGQQHLLDRLREQGKVAGFESQIVRKDGTIIWISENMHAIMSVNGDVLAYEGFAQDITIQKETQKQLWHSAHHDALTGLPNRRLFLQRLERALEHAKQDGQFSFAVLFLDFDRFKVVNDSLGHSVGDQLLIAIARRMEAILRFDDVIARLGGDEFVILLENIDCLNEILPIVTRIQQEMNIPHSFSGHEVVTTVSLGIALNRDMQSGKLLYEHPEDIIRDADIAMYRAKAQGRACSEIFDPSMYLQAMKRLQVETDLRHAIEQQQLCLHYQPLVELEQREVVGFEALVRWQHPHHGLLAPSEFLAVAEETGLHYAIDRWVLYKACRQLHAWQTQFRSLPQLPSHTIPLPELMISINISRDVAMHTDFVAQVGQTLTDTGLDASCLTVEITEHTATQDSEQEKQTLGRLRNLGIQLCIDDFGTGYASLNYLRHFPVQTVKIDSSFIAKMLSDTESMEIVRLIITLTHTLNIKAIAKGVETAEQCAALQAMGCDYAQGRFFFSPMPKDEIEALLADQVKRYTSCKERSA